jgi:hypothetical protein
MRYYPTNHLGATNGLSKTSRLLQTAANQRSEKQEQYDTG